MQRTIKTAVGQLALFETGQGAPALFWPSLYVDHRSFDGVVSALASERRCIVVDGPGHGASPGPLAPYDLRACARAAIEVLDALGIERTDWVGNAWGGHVGACVAIGFPERIKTLTAIAAPMQPLSRKLKLQTRLLLLMLRLGLADSVGKILASAMLSRSAASSARDYVRQCVRGARRAALSLAVRSISIGREDLVPELHRIACPTLFVAGVDDPMYPPVLAAAQAARMTGARCETLTGAGHLGPLERPGDTVNLLRAHWTAHTGAAEPFFQSSRGDDVEALAVKDGWNYPSA